MLNRKQHPGLILAACICMMAGMVGMANANGVLFAQILQDMNFRAGDLSVYYTIKSLVSAACITLTVRLAFSGHGRLFMTGYGLLMAVSYGIMICFHSLWQWYAAAVLAGIANASTFTVIPVILNSRFHKNGGAVLGLAMSASGLGGVVFSPVLSACIRLAGWRVTALFMGAAVFILVCLPALLLLPTDLSGAEKESSQPAGTGLPDRKRPGWVFILCMLVMLLPALEIQFPNQIPTFAVSMGFGLGMGSVMTSLTMCGNVGGKFLLGFLSDRLQIVRAMSLIMILALLSSVLFLLSGLGAWAAFLACPLLGLAYSMYSTGPALLLLKVYGVKTYAKVMARIQTIVSFVIAVCSSAIGYVYDLSGSYMPVFAAFAVFNAVTLLILWRLGLFTAKPENMS